MTIPDGVSREPLGKPYLLLSSVMGLAPQETRPVPPLP